METNSDAEVIALSPKTLLATNMFIWEGQKWTFVQAKSEIVQKVCDIVKKQLVVSDDSNAIGESKFTTLVKLVIYWYLIIAFF
ncbi:acyl carrier protein 1, chloroplastic [Trifolium repens]|nr:acyl carrier protein 1, chloroplastic [Trifolium repens]KAK2418380.1 acyl carrier protein 1, chloroplastic [Trifolium repens]